MWFNHRHKYVRWRRLPFVAGSCSKHPCPQNSSTSRWAHHPNLPPTALERVLSVPHLPQTLPLKKKTCLVKAWSQCSKPKNHTNILCSIASEVLILVLFDMVESRAAGKPRGWQPPWYIYWSQCHRKLIIAHYKMYIDVYKGKSFVYFCFYLPATSNNITEKLECKQPTRNPNCWSPLLYK